MQEVATRNNLLEHALTKALSRLDDLAQIKTDVSELKSVCSKMDDDLLDMCDRVTSIETAIKGLQTWKKRLMTWVIAAGLGASGGTLKDRVGEFLPRDESREEAVLSD